MERTTMVTKPKTRKAPAAKIDEKLLFKMLTIAENKIAEAELYGLPCRACFACHHLTCRKAGFFRMREKIHSEMYG
jgi:multimeric flavodoxin WrbA